MMDEVIFILLVFVIALFPLGTSIWAGVDASDRGKPGCLVALLVFFIGWPFSLLLYLFIRPERPRSY